MGGTEIFPTDILMIAIIIGEAILVITEFIVCGFNLVEFVVQQRYQFDRPWLEIRSRSRPSYVRWQRKCECPVFGLYSCHFLVGF